MQIRQNRLLGLKAHHDDDQYIDRKAVAEEVAFSRKLCAKHNWPIIDVTRRSIEETAAAVMACWPSAAGSRWREPMSLWLADAAAGARLEERGAARAAGGAGIPVEMQPADIDERAIEATRRHRRCRARSRRCWRARRRARLRRSCPGRLVLGADQTLALGERAVLQAGRSRGRARAAQGAARHEPTRCIPAIAIARDGAIVFEHRDVARLTMRAFSDGFLDAYLDAAGDGGDGERRRLSARRLGIQLFERIEGDHFTILGLPLLPLLRFSAARRA